MSFNSPLNFSIKKSTPTTSTTNTTSADDKKEFRISDASVASNSVFLLNILSINDKLSPIKSLNLLLKAAAPLSITKTNELPQPLCDSDKKQDLVNLFDRYDISTVVDDKQESILSNEKDSLTVDEKSEENEEKEEGSVQATSGDISEMVEVSKLSIGDENGKRGEDLSLKLEENPTIEVPIETSMKNDLIDLSELGAGSDEVWGNIENSKVILEESKVDKLADDLVSQDHQPTSANNQSDPEHDESQFDVKKQFDSELSNPTSSTQELDLLNSKLSIESSNIEDQLTLNVGKANGSSFSLKENTDSTANDLLIDLTLEGNIPKSMQLPREFNEETESNNIEPHFQEPINQDNLHQQSHKPFDFQIFLTQLRKKSADPIVRYIRSFLVSMTRQGHTFTAEQRIITILEFKVFMNEKFAIFEPFKSMDEIDLENSREGLEKLMMNRLYDQCFPNEVAKHEIGYIPPTFVEDLKKDEMLYEQFEKYSWVNAQHLDIDLVSLSDNESKDINFIEFSVIELNKINDYRAPRDKIICILNSCKIIFGFLKNRKQETNADSFIPILIMIIIKAKTKNLISNLHYIESYRGEEWLNKGETSYYLSSVQAAVTFILELDRNNLTINDTEYDAHMEAWEAEKKQKVLKEKNQELLQPHPRSARGDTLSPSKVLLTSADMLSKSITNFLSPSPESAGPVGKPEPVSPPPTTEPVDSELLKKTFESLQEIFSALDQGVMKDIIFLNKGDFEKSLDQCLELINET